MIKLVCGALALTMTSNAAFASEGEYPALDQDIQALSASLSELESSGVKVGGRIRAIYAWASDDFVDDNGTPSDPADDTEFDLGGFDILEARIKLTGSRGDIGYVLQIDAADAGTNSLLKDAYINVPLGESLTVRMGRFKALISRSALISSGKLFFVDRTLVGSLFAARQDGVALLGRFDTLDWAITVQDGSDGDEQDVLLAIRGQIHFLGEGLDQIEGAYGAGEEIEATASAAFFDDGAADDGTGFVFEAGAATNVYSVSGYVANFDDDLVTVNSSSGAIPGGFDIRGVLAADSTPFGIAATFMVVPPTDNQGGWELGARYQNNDGDDNTDVDIIDLGVDYYGSGHNYKYFLVWTSVDGDAPNSDFDLFRIGVALVF